MKTFLKKILVYILTAQARAVLKKYRPHIIAITGSVGKTSTKDAIYSVVSQGSYVHKSEKSFNSEIGVPLTILGVPNAWGNPLKWMQNILEGFFLLLMHSHYPQWLVLEVGADRPGDIKSIASWLKVDVAVITPLPEIPVHVEFFDSPQAVVEEKAALINAIKPFGFLVLYGDDEKSEEFRRKVTKDVTTLTFGFSPKCDVYAQDLAVVSEEGDLPWPIGMSAQLNFGVRSLPISIVGTVGKHSLLPAVAAAAVGVALGKDSSNIAEALKNYSPPSGRMRLLRGVKDTLIIDDTYNSSPAAVIAALDTLELVGGGGPSSDLGVTPSGRAEKNLGITPARRIAVLGDMTELGRFSVGEHKKVGAIVAKAADVLLTVGFRARGIADGAKMAGMNSKSVHQFEDASKAGDVLDDILRPGDIVLVKGSQVMRMERVVEQIMAEPARAAELLVRQDKEWRKR